MKRKEVKYRKVNERKSHTHINTRLASYAPRSSANFLRVGAEPETSELCG